MIPNVGIVSYKNTAPLQYGLQLLHDEGSIILSKEYPALLAEKLENNQLDIALVPVAFLKGKDNYSIFGHHCIASNKEVASVCIFSECPITEVKELYLDYQSRTSIQLAKILLEKYWHLDVQYLQADEDYISKISGATAGVIIGDRAFEAAEKFKYRYDLANAWFALTGLPFVFAVWVTNKPFDIDFANKFESANAQGLLIKNQIAKDLNYPFYNLEKYYNENIDFIIDEDKRKAIDLFLKMF